jgi:hypothetical protein
MKWIGSQLERVPRFRGLLLLLLLLLQMLITRITSSGVLPKVSRPRCHVPCAMCRSLASDLFAAAQAVVISRKPPSGPDASPLLFY